MDTWETLAAIAALGLATLATRGFFIWPERELPLPRWLRQGLRYAPLAAMAAIAAPEIVTHRGTPIDTWQDPRLFAVAAAVGWYFWRRGILGTIVVGTVVLLGLRLGAGW
jgi:branched-subunit amino acid transport protein